MVPLVAGSFGDETDGMRRGREAAEFLAIGHLSLIPSEHKGCPELIFICWLLLWVPWRSSAGHFYL
jgi:hypothetical protein